MGHLKKSSPSFYCFFSVDVLFAVLVFFLSLPYAFSFLTESSFPFRLLTALFCFILVFLLFLNYMLAVFYPYLVPCCCCFLFFGFFFSFVILSSSLSPSCFVFFFLFMYLLLLFFSSVFVFLSYPFSSSSFFFLFFFSFFFHLIL